MKINGYFDLGGSNNCCEEYCKIEDVNELYALQRLLYERHKTEGCYVIIQQ